jgi:hypothetical protein
MLSILALAGLYIGMIALFTTTSIASWAFLARTRGWAPDPPRVLIAIAVGAAWIVASAVRAFVRRHAGKVQPAPATQKTLPDTGQSQPWFVAMQYYALILNRTYKVFITDRMLCGAKVTGLVASPLSPEPDQLEPDYWARTLEATLYERIDVTSPLFLRMNGANFQIPWTGIREIEFSTAEKWGMGNVPYSGRIFLRLKSGRSKELILLGTQDGPGLREMLQKKLQK